MKQPLSPVANAAWEAFNEVAERVGVFEDYGDALAAFARALADQAGSAKHWHVNEIRAIAAELEGVNG
jgi:hypothetical protein